MTWGTSHTHNSFSSHLSTIAGVSFDHALICTLPLTETSFQCPPVLTMAVNDAPKWSYCILSLLTIKIKQRQLIMITTSNIYLLV